MTSPELFLRCAALLSVPALLLVSLTARGQDEAAPEWPKPEDVASPAAVVQATYASIARAPGAPYEWERFHSLFLPGAQLISNTRQTGGEFRPMSSEDFEAWIMEVAPPGHPNDRGFTEEQLWNETRTYGVIATVLSTYQKRFWGQDEVLGRGINSFQLVKHEDRWWITGLVWDEEPDAGPIPREFGGDPGPPDEDR